jgi:hypothetical protein
MADSDEKKFTVTDRRSFDPSGESKAPVTPAAPAARPADEATAKAAPKKNTDSPRHLPPADFATLVLSLGSSAVMYLGQDDQGQEQGKAPPPNLPMAKHAIDLLTVLEEKTKGNLTGEEQQILESLLFDLRLRYVEALKAGGGAS